MGLSQASQFRTVPASIVRIYRTSKQTSTYNPHVSYQKNTNRTGHVSANFGQYQPVSGVPAGKEKSFFFFLSFVIFEFLLGQNGNLFALTY